MEDTAVKTYTRADVEFLGEHLMEGPYTTANRYKVGDNFYLIIRHRVHAAANHALAKEGLGYGESYEPYTQMQVVQVDQHVSGGPNNWPTLVVLNHQEDEEEGLKHILTLANVDPEGGAIALLESAGAIDLTNNPIAAEAQDALLVDPETDQILDEVAQAIVEGELDEPEGPALTIDPDTR
jgi:hypothetical protein